MSLTVDEKKVFDQTLRCLGLGLNGGIAGSLGGINYSSEKPDGTKVAIVSATLGNEFYYDNLPLCLIDTVYSIGANYNSACAPTVARFASRAGISNMYQTPHGRITDTYTITDLITELSKYHDYGASDIFKNNRPTSSKSGILRSEAIFREAKILEKFGINTLSDFRDLMYNRVSVLLDFEKEYVSIPGQRDRKVSLAYFEMLSGNDDHMKIDRWLTRFTESAIGHTVTTIDCESILINVCKELKLSFPYLTPRLYDNMIWKLMSDNKKRIV